MRWNRDDANFEKDCEEQGWKLCNCAGCGRAITSRARGFRKLAGRMQGRPYCGECLDTKRRRR